MKTFIESQFNYCPLTWMFHSRQLNSKINKLHERALRIVYKNPNLNFQQLLDLDKTHCIHHRNLQKLAVEMYKVSKENLYLHQYKSFFLHMKIHITSQRCWKSHNVRTFTYRGQKTWHLPDSIRNSQSLKEFSS